MAEDDATEEEATRTYRSDRVLAVWQALRPAAPGVGLFVAAAVAATGLCWLLSSFRPVPALRDLRLEPVCQWGAGAASEALTLYAAQSHWVAMVALVAVCAAIALVAAFLAIIAVERDTIAPAPPALRVGFWTLMGLGAVAIALYQWILAARGGGLPAALLATLPYDACDRIRGGAVVVRRLWESVAIVGGLAMTALVILPVEPTAAAIDRRLRALSRLLVSGAMLFVAGVLVSRASLAWVAATWDYAEQTEGFRAVVQGLVDSGTVQAGVAGSALLAIFFLPTRAILLRQFPRAEPREAGQRLPRKDALALAAALLAPLAAATLLTL